MQMQPMSVQKLKALQNSMSITIFLHSMVCNNTSICKAVTDSSIKNHPVFVFIGARCCYIEVACLLLLS